MRLLILIFGTFLPYDEAYKVHKETSEPLIIMVTADWCEPCKAAKPHLEKLVKNMDVVITTVAPEDYPELTGNSPIPQFHIFNHGKYTKIVGYKEGLIREAIRVIE